MILKSENGTATTEPGKRLPPGLPAEEPATKPHVSLLEFLSVDLPRRGRASADGVRSVSAQAPENGVHSVEGPGPEKPGVAHDDELAHERAVQIRAMVEAARTETRLATRREMTAEYEQHLHTERERLAEVCAEFMRDRQRYFADAEEQVVKLALAIAARVLHRESMMDPLLLAGAVRVAIAKVEDTSGIALRVEPAAAAVWRELFPADAEPEVEVIGDDRLGQGEVVLETVVGRVELGVAVQLEEIEQGFFDLLQRRPN